MKCVPVLENQYKNLKLNNKQSFVLERLQEVLAVYEQKSTLDALLNGGEHPGKYTEQLEFLASSQKGSDFWLSTTGHLLTFEKARELKASGLVGVVIQLHHYDPEKHNALQSYKHSYGWVLKAVESVRKAGLLLGFRLCPSPDFTTIEHLFSYARQAKKLGASIIHIADPATVWARHNNFLKLNLEQIQLLDDFTELLNYDNEYQEWPVISYSSSLLNKLGTASNEEQSLCVDAEGKVSACSL